MTISLLPLGLLALLASAALGQVQASVVKYRFHLTNLDGKNGERGSFVLELHPEWAPKGAARFQEMVASDFYKGVRFFRVIDGFMAQYGIHPKPAVAKEWVDKRLVDDPVLETNVRGMVSFATSGKGRGMVSFATSGKDSRTTQTFINFGDNANLDGMGFAPFAKVVEGMEVVDRIFKIGEKPNQGRIQAEGGKYLKREFPQLTYIESVEVLDGEKIEL